MTTLAQEFGFTTDQLEALRNRGFDLIEAGDHQEAVNVFQGLVELTPDEGSVHAALGAALQEQGKTDEAIAAYDEAIRLEAFAPLARVNRGELLCKRGDPKGLEDLRVAAGRKSAVQGRAQALLRRYGG